MKGGGCKEEKEVERWRVKGEGVERWRVAHEGTRKDITWRMETGGVKWWRVNVRWRMEWLRRGGGRPKS